MTESRAVSIDEIRSLVAERQRYDDWLTALEARRADTPVRVFERVHGDYVVRRDLVMAQLREHIGVLSAHGDELDGRHAALEAELATLEDERAEAMLRTAVGEYDDDRWATVREDVETKLAALGEQRDGLLLEIDEIHTLLSSARREPPAAVAEVVPAAIAPAAEVDIPLGVGAEGVADVRLVAAMPELADFDEEPLPVMETTQEFDDALALFSDEPAAPDTPVAPVLEGIEVELEVHGGAAAADVADAFDDLAFLRSVTEPTPTSAPGAPFTATPAVPFTQAPAVTPALPTGAVPHDPVKTLRCTECGTMNLPTEWYCERCGGELAAF
ncbi:MAG: hypothetical protein P3C09_06910 [Gemmatimonadota bacterium]|nr:hypothetical protein [Gemmatimonadota bacterium]